MGSVEQKADGVDGSGTKSVLIAGASFAGLSAAWWMHRLGYAVTVVEVAGQLRKGGTPVDIREGVVDVVRRMGLLERVAARSLPAKADEFLDPEGVPLVLGAHPWEGREGSREGHEIERDALLDLLFDEVKDDVEFVFDDSIATLGETAGGVAVTFVHGAARSFSLVLGCDGTHSAVRRMCFGEESAFLLFLQNYFSLTIVPRLLIAEDTQTMFNLPGRTVMLSAYKGKTDIAFCFASEQEIAYDRRNRAEQKKMIAEHFARVGWRVPELLEAMHGCDDFYFDKLCQIRMPEWSKGRVALVGDAAYCPSPAAGMGGSVAILGACALADALARFPDDYTRAFEEYDRSFRPTIEEIQVRAVEEGVPMFMPATDEALVQRNRQLTGD